MRNGTRGAAIGGAAALLSLALAAPAFAAFSGVNGRIVFVSYRGDGAPSLFTLDPTLATPAAVAASTTQLTDSGDDLEPAVDPSGTKVAFSRTTDGTAGIFLVPLDSVDRDADVTPVVDTSAEETDPSWSPDGHTLVYVSTQGSVHSLRTIDTDNLAAGSTLLFSDTANDDQPVFSPTDPTTIAFVRTTAGVSNLYTYNTVTGLSTNISNVASNDTKPDFGPNGSWLVFQSDRTGRSQIWTIKIDGTGAHLLLGSDSGKTDTRPAFSPDGQRVVFVRPAAGLSGEIEDTYSAPLTYSANSGPSASSASLQDISANSAKDDMPAWAPVAGTGPALPEAPAVGLLALGGLAVGGGVVVARRRKA